MNVAEKNAQRLKSVLCTDKKHSPQKLEKILRADLSEVLKNYFVFSDQEVFIKIDVDTDGAYLVKVLVRCENMKAIHCLL